MNFLGPFIFFINTRQPRWYGCAKVNGAVKLPQFREECRSVGFISLFQTNGQKYGLHAWNALEGVEVSTAGWIFIGAGVLFTLLLGGGLMALVFYSSREGMDR